MLKIVVWMNHPSHHQTDFFNELSSRCIDFRVIYYGDVPNSRLEQGWSEEFYETYSKRISEFSSIDEVLSVHRDFIHVVPGQGVPLLRQLVRRLVENNIPWLHWSESIKHGWKRTLSRFVYARYARTINTAALGAMSIGPESRRMLIEWGVCSSKIVSCPYTLPKLPNSRVDSEILDFAGGRTIFLTVAQLTTRKGIRELLREFYQALKFSNGGMCLIIVGKDYSKGRYKKEVEKLGLEKYILFKGVVNHSELSSIYRASDVFVLLSLFDGWGVVINEAASMSLPIISSLYVGASYELVRNGVSGFVVSPKIKGETATAMVAYHRSIDLRAKHGVNSKNLVEDYSPPRVASRLLAEISSLVTLREANIDN